jgi:hypothetical protein
VPRVRTWSNSARRTKLFDGKRNDGNESGNAWNVTENEWNKNGNGSKRNEND